MTAWIYCWSIDISVDGMDITDIAIDGVEIAVDDIDI